jgi:hypothetical protein
MSYYLYGIDFQKHNEEVKQVWDAFNAGKPIRVPVTLGINPRIFLLNPELNKEGVTFKDYSEDPDLMAVTTCFRIWRWDCQKMAGMCM